MDAKKFQSEKTKIISNWKDFKFLQDVKATAEAAFASSDFERFDEAKFEYNDQDEACKQLKWPDEEDYHEQVVIIVKDFLKFKLDAEWEVRKMVTDTVPIYHMGVVRATGKRAETIQKNKPISPRSPRSPTPSEKKKEKKSGPVQVELSSLSRVAERPAITDLSVDEEEDDQPKKKRSFMEKVIGKSKKGKDEPKKKSGKKEESQEESSEDDVFKLGAGGF